MVGVGAVPTHRVSGPRSHGNLDVLVAEVGQPLSRCRTDKDSAFTVAGDYERGSGNGRCIVDPGFKANDLLPVCQRRIELGLEQAPRSKLDLRPSGELDPAPGHGAVKVVTEALDHLLGVVLLCRPVVSWRPGEPRRILQNGSPDEIGPGRENDPGDACTHRVTDQDRHLLAPTSECLQETYQVSDHARRPVNAPRGRIEARRVAVSPSVRRNDAILVAPAAHSVWPAQPRVGKAMQQHQGRASISPELVDHESTLLRRLRHAHKYRRLPSRLADVEAKQDGPSERGRIELVPDEDGRGGVTVMMDGSPQSHVVPADPRNLGFEYIAHFAAVIDTLPTGPLGITHIGGAGLTLARYVNAERPGSPQIVLEPNVELTEQVRRELPLPRQHRIRVRPVDGLTGVTQLGNASADVLVLDAYADGRVPAELTTVEFLADASRVLRTGGTMLLNIADEPNTAYLRRVYAGLVTVFGQVALISTHEVLKGKRFGNTVAVASHDALDIAALRRQVARMPFPTGLRDGGQLSRQFAGSAAFTTADSAQSPPPPPVKGWRVR